MRESRAAAAASRDACPCCGGEELDRGRTVDGFRWARCAGCRTWRLLDDASAELGSRWLANAGWPPPEPMVRSHERTLGELERLTAGRRLLDVGAGRGDLVAAARRRRWAAVGIEPYERAVEEARGVFDLELVLAEWGPDVVAGESFDVVVLHHVIEHLPHPRRALEAAREALVRGGILFVAAPSVRTVDVLVSRRTRAAIFDAPRHRYVFSDRSLARLIRASGFSIVSARPQVSRLARPILQSRLSTLAGLNALATRDAGDVLRDDPVRVTMTARTDDRPHPRRAAIVDRAVGIGRVVLPGGEVRLFARRPG